MKKVLFLLVILMLGCQDPYLEMISLEEEISMLEETTTLEETSNISSDLIVWYPFNNNSNDESGNNLHATVYEAELDYDRHDSINSSYKFDINDNPSWGERDDVLITEYDSIMDVDSFTLLAWVKPQTKPSPYEGRPSTIMSRWDGDGLNSIFRFQILSNGEIHFQMEDESFYSEYMLEYDTWSHVALSYDNGVIKFYVNSILVNLTQTDIILKTMPSHLTIGETWMGNGNWYHFNGNLDDIGISNGSLTECEIRSFYNL
jgi:hypothetical protein